MEHDPDKSVHATDGWHRHAVASARPEAALQHVARMARDGIDGCDAASVTLLRNGRAMSVASTAEVARELDAVQWLADEGPSLDAIRQLQVFNVKKPSMERSWPRFGAAAEANGIHASLSVPITVGGDALGALNLYGRRPNALDGCAADALKFATQAADALAGARLGVVDVAESHERPSPRRRAVELDGFLIKRDSRSGAA